ncbi:TPA: putative zinc ribbon protein [Citrobacter farmeri]
MRVNTTVRKWHCIWCDYRYYGTKQCPLCSEWTYTLEDNG